MVGVSHQVAYDVLTEYLLKIMHLIRRPRRESILKIHVPCAIRIDVLIDPEIVKRKKRKYEYEIAQRSAEGAE